MKTKPKALKPTKKQPAKSEASDTKPNDTKIKAVIDHSEVDRYCAYNSEGRFKSGEYAKRLIKGIEKLPKFSTKAFLLTKGTKGLLINEVECDESRRLYRRKHEDRHIYGDVSLMGEITPDFRADLLSPKALVERALKKAKVMRFKNRDTKEEVDVALLNPTTDSYFVGVTITGGKLRVLNMEPPASYNDKRVQWAQLRDVTDEKLITALTNFKA